jgi:hypothetical protein
MKVPKDQLDQALRKLLATPPLPLAEIKNKRRVMRRKRTKATR